VLRATISDCLLTAIVSSGEGKRTERFSEKSLNLENSLSNLRLGFPRVKRHFSYEGNEQKSW
jgi:hypothetical protein